MDLFKNVSRIIMIINEAKTIPSTANYNFNVYAKTSDDEARTRLSLMTNLNLKNVLKAVPIYYSKE